MTLSLCMIVKNEEEVLARCLHCIKHIADEIIIVDTGSTDQTKSIAHTFTTQVYDFPWQDDFAAARNFAFSKATMDFSMWLDADDVLSPSEQEKLLQLKNELTKEHDMVFLPYDVAFDEQGSPVVSYYRERIVRTAAHFRFTGEIHEAIIPAGNILYRDVHIRHQKERPNEPGRNLRIFQKMLAEGKTLDARQTYYYGRELMYAGMTEQACVQFERFLTQGGFVENEIEACKDWAACLTSLDQPKEALSVLFKSFSYAAPRAEICCDIGAHFMQAQDFETAIFWYELATTLTPPIENGGFCLLDCYDYLPHIQLCVCYDRLGQRELAMLHNEKAGAAKKDDPAYLHNKAYFACSGITD